MAKKKRKKKTDPEAALRNKRIAIGSAIVLGSAAVFASAGMGIKAIDTRAAELILTTDSESEVVSTPQIQINWGTDSTGHAWMPISERERVQEKVSAAINQSNALSWRPLYQASRTLASTGWVMEEPIAKWADDGSIVIDANWRVPAAAVRIGDQDFIIDFNANVLPLQYAKDESNQFIIHNPSRSNPGVGNQWDEPEIHDALSLINELKKNQLLVQVTGIDLGTGRDHGILQILTDNGGRIVWGGGPGKSRPAEMPGSVKIERLSSLLNKTGRIDAGAMILDIRGQNITMQRHEN